MDASLDMIDSPALKKVKIDKEDSSFLSSNNGTIFQDGGCISVTQSKTDKKGTQLSHERYDPNKPEGLKFVEYKFDSDNFYDINTFPRGILTILNVENFQESSGLEKFPRTGTNVDAINLRVLFLKLGFIVHIYNNPDSTDALNILQESANQDYSSMSCCVVAVLTHGKEGELCFTDQSLNINELTKLFKTKALKGKPKLFLFQACRGDKFMSNFDTVDGPGTQLLKNSHHLDLPVESDFLCAYSTVFEHFSFRNSVNGSWFIEAVVSVFCKYAHKMDVVRLFTRVNEEISKKIPITDDAKAKNKKQIGSIVSQFRKELFLPPINGPISNM